MIDITKKYRTRDGREVRIYATDGVDDYPVHGAFLSKDGWKVEVWDQRGFWNDPDHEDDADLIEVKPRIQREVWVNVYRTEAIYGIYRDKGTADLNASPTRIACVRLTIDCEEGEGL